MRLNAARAVELALEHHANRGELAFVEKGLLRLDRIQFRIGWDERRTFLLVLDFAASELCFPGLATKIDSRSASFRAMSARLRVGAGRDMAVFIRRSTLVLRMTVRDGAYAHCTSLILQVAKEFVTEILVEEYGREDRLSKLPARCG